MTGIPVTKFMCHPFGFRDDASEFPNSEQIVFWIDRGCFFKEVNERRRRRKCSRDILVMKRESRHPQKQGLAIHWGNKDPSEPGKNKQVLLQSELFFRIPWQATNHSAL